MTKSLIQRITRTTEGMNLYQRERTLLETTDLIHQAMEEHGLTTEELARIVGWSTEGLEKILEGTMPASLQDLTEIFTALGLALHLTTEPIENTTKEIEAKK